jgi:hypothetical protein
MKDTYAKMLPMMKYLQLIHAGKETAITVKTDMFTVKAEYSYSNGQLGIVWKGGEIRQIPQSLYKRLIHDDAYCWRIID